MTYDDYKSLKIDGEELINNTSWSAVPTATKELSTGWHRWEARVTDTGGGGWGAGSRNNGNTLSYIAPEDAAEPVEIIESVETEWLGSEQEPCI